VAKLQGGGHQFEVLSIADVEKARASSRARGADSPWATHWDEMAKKTAVRRLFKYLPVSIELQKAVGIDEQAEAGLPQNLESFVVEDVAEIEDNPVDNLKNRLTTSKPTEAPAAQAPGPAPEPEDDLPDSITGDSQAVEPEEFSDPSGHIDVFAELEATAKRIYGNKGAEKIALMAKKAGFKGSKITEAEAGMLLDLLNEGAAS
jgi:hypothetical protein